MYQVDIQKITPELLSWSEKVFDEEYIANLKSKKPRYEQSLIARAMVNKLSKTLGKPITTPKIVIDRLPCESGFYWSVSHTPTHVAVVVGVHPVSIDIETLKPRDPNLLDRYPLSWYQKLMIENEEKNWKGFYHLWTMEESLFKLDNSTMEYPDFELIKYDMTTKKYYSTKHNHDYQSIFNYRDDHIICLTQKP